MPDSDSAFAPSDIYAERQVIGACLLSPVAVKHMMVAVKASDFYFGPYAAAFSAISALHKSSVPIGFETVAHYMAEQKSQGGTSVLDDIGGGGAIAETMVECEPAAANYWADIVKKRKGERDVLGIAEYMRQQAVSGPLDIAKVVADVVVKLSGVESSKSKKRVISAEDAEADLAELLNRYITRPDDISGLATGWAQFDRAADGCKPGNVTIVYAPSGRFKSFFTLNMGYKFARAGIPGLWFTTEMPRVQVQERLLQLEAQINIRWARRDGTIVRRQKQVEDAARRIARYPIYFCDSDELDIASFRADVLTHARDHGVQYVIVDLMDFVSTSVYKDDSISQQASIMRAMKSVAKAANVHIIMVTHVAKGDRGSRSKPSLDVEDMKGSSAKYQDVDMAISLMPVVRDRITGEYIGMDRNAIRAAQKLHQPMVVLVSITKNRHGEMDDIPFSIDFSEGGIMRPLAGPRIVQAVFPVSPPDEDNLEEEEE